MYTFKRKEIERTQPQYQQLEDDNARLKASLMSKKEMQGQTLQTLEGIKADKQVLQHQKVRTLEYPSRLTSYL